jgi:CRP/FNR family transcriptional regulator, nitrogen oxide reductase regulator
MGIADKKRYEVPEWRGAVGDASIASDRNRLVHPHLALKGERPPLFAGIPPGEYDKISSAARFRKFARGEILHGDGEAVREVLLLTSGFAKTSKIGVSGVEVILALSAPGDVLGAVRLFSTGRHCTSAHALRACRALVWDAATFQNLIRGFPLLRENLCRILGEYMRELQERFREVATERVGMRVARQLVRLHHRIGRPVDGEIEVGLSREELAQMTGTTLFTVSRLLAAWETRGWVKSRREAVTVCDIPSLEGFAGDRPFRALVSPAPASSVYASHRTSDMRV